MSKKILALALAILFIATAFTACKQKLETTKINGKEFVLYTDDAGNTVISEDNRIAIAVTDASGEIVTQSNREPQTNWVQLYGDIKGETFIRGEKYQMNALDGWVPESLGKIIKNETNGRCYVQFIEIAKVTREVTLNSYLDAIDKQNAKMVSGYEKQGYTLNIEKEDRNITEEEISCKFYKYEVKDKDGKIIHYAENYYFVAEKTIYKVAYVCEEGIGYDESFNFEAYLNTSFTFKAEK